MSNIGYKFWLKPTLPALEKVLSPIVENAEDENVKTQTDVASERLGPPARDHNNSDPTLDTFILHT
jgi:hypothetical protein